MATSRVLAALAVLLFGLAATAAAQDFVPGGWSPQVGFQTFSGPGFAGASASFGYGFPSAGGYGMSGFGGFAAGNPYAFGMGVAPRNGLGNRVFSTPPSGQAYRGLTPLAHSIRHATRRRGR